jgi:membrane carboxypeptidase/penicillin-binding protein
VGFDDGSPLGLVGARAALPIFGRFLIDALGTRGGADFPEPPGLESFQIHEPTGLRAGFLCWGRREWFLVGTAPRERCGPGWFSRAEPPPDHDRPSPPRRPPPDPIGRVLDRLREIVGEVAPQR